MTKKILRYSTAVSLFLLFIIFHCTKKPNQPNTNEEVPGIIIEKSTNGEDADNPPGPNTLTGSQVTWRYEVTNSGEVALSNILVSDNVEGVEPAYQSGDDGDDILDIDETWIYEATGVAIQGQYTNVGSVTSKDQQGIEVSDIDSSHYCGVNSEYTVSLPPGKLPWPHHRPDMTQEEYDQMIQNLWICDNFGTYHASDDSIYLYFHDGLDVMLNDGTKIYALRSGHVKSTANRCIAILDADKETDEKYGWGWEYTHTDNFQFNVGDFVRKGEYIANIEMGHVHLSRIRVVNGNWADKENREYFHADSFFVYKDTKPPIILTPFYYFENNSDQPFVEGQPTTVSGDVDIVVAMKDLAEVTDDTPNESWRRWCVARIEYEISGNSIQTISKESFDFTKLIFDDWEDMSDDRVLRVYKHHTVPVLQNTGISRSFAFYIITNCEGLEEVNSVSTIDPSSAWNTAALDGSGNPQFPNGLYTITVTAYDAHGNSSSESDIVRVEN